MPRRVKPCDGQRSLRVGGGSSAVEADDRGGSNQHPASLNVKTARSWRGIVPFTHLAREGRMTVTIGRRELLAALGGAAATWPLAARAAERAHAAGRRVMNRRISREMCGSAMH